MRVIFSHLNDPEYNFDYDMIMFRVKFNWQLFHPKNIISICNNNVRWDCNAMVIAALSNCIKVIGAIDLLMMRVK